MNFRLFVVLLSLPSILLGQDPHHVPNPTPPPEELDLTEISIGMSSDDFQTREEATLRLLELSRTNLSGLATALFQEARTTRDPEVRFRARATFNRIFDFRVLGKGDANLGVTWNWHIQQTHNDEMRARPLVRAIEPHSPAAKAGLKVGDIVCYVDDKELPRRTGIPALRKIFRESAPGTKLTLTVRSTKLQRDRLSSNLSPNRKVTIQIQDTEKGLREAKEGEFAKWYSNLQKLYDKTD